MAMIDMATANMAEKGGGYSRLIAAICQQAFEDLKAEYALAAKCKTDIGKSVALYRASLLEKWFLGEDTYVFLTGYTNGDKIIREAKHQAGLLE